MLLIADGGERAGLGHISRSSALTIALRRRGCEVEARVYRGDGPIERDGVIWKPVEDLALPGDADVLVLDSYKVPAATASSIAGSTPLVVMHDYGEPPPTAALVVSVAGSRSDRPPMLVGPAYACLRPSYWGLARRRVADEVRSVLVVTGSGGGGFGGELACALQEALPEAGVRLVRGPYAPSAPPGVTVLEAPESLLEPLLAADLVVGGAGQTILEALATGAPSVALPLVDNQLRQARALADEDAVCLVDQPTVEAAVDAARGLAVDGVTRRRLAERAQATVDGLGALRVASHVATLVRGRPDPPVS